MANVGQRLIENFVNLLNDIFEFGAVQTYEHLVEPISKKSAKDVYTCKKPSSMQPKSSHPKFLTKALRLAITMFGFLFTAQVGMEDDDEEDEEDDEDEDDDE